MTLHPNLWLMEAMEVASTLLNCPLDETTKDPRATSLYLSVDPNLYMYATATATEMLAL